MSTIISATKIEEIVNILYALVCPMLGSHSCIKCISQTDSDVFTTDVETLISSLDFEPACVELLIEVLQSHKKQHKRGTKSLLFMITRLAKAVFFLKQWGIPTEMSLKIIHNHILELTKSVEELTREILADRTQLHYHDKSKKEKQTCTLGLEEENSQCQAMLKNSDTESHTTVLEGEEKVSVSQIFSSIHPNNDCDGFADIWLDKPLANFDAIGNGAANSSSQSKSDECNTEPVELFFQDISQDIQDCKSLQNPKTKIKLNKAKKVSTFSSLNKDPQTISKPESACEVISAYKCVDHEVECVGSFTWKPNGKYLSYIDINNCASSCTAELPIYHQTDNQPASSSKSSFSDQYLQVTNTSLPSCETSKPDTLHRTTQNTDIVKEQHTTGHNSSSLSTINQMLSKLGTPKLKPSVSYTSRHLQTNLATSVKQDAQSNTPHTSRAQDWGVNQETVSDSEVSNAHTDLSLHHIHFPQELLYLDSCHLEMMQIVKQIYVGQLQITKKVFFNPNLVDCLHVPVSPSRLKAHFLTATTASVHPGLIIACKTVDPTLFNVRDKKSTLMINADLTPLYHHKGYKPTLSKKNVVSRISDMERPQGDVSWDLKTLNFIKRLKVTLVLVRGQASDQLVDMCSQIGVAILTNIPYRTLSVLASHHGVEMLSYIENCVQANVCSLCLEPFSETWLDQRETQQTKSELLYFYVSNVPIIQTVILSSSCAMSSQLVEERLWKCFHAVANAVSDGRLLPGAGETELWCSTRLKEVSDNLLTKSSLESFVVESLADVFWDFSNRVKMNSLASSGSSAVTVCSLDAGTKSSNSTFLNQIEKVTAIQAADSLSSITKSKTSCDALSETMLQGNQEKTALPTQPSMCTRTQYDNYQSKVALWVTAVDVVCMLVSLGSSVLTGITPDLADF